MRRWYSSSEESMDGKRDRQALSDPKPISNDDQSPPEQLQPLDYASHQPTKNMKLEISRLNGSDSAIKVASSSEVAKV
jgi:hypothetical protein